MKKFTACLLSLLIAVLAAVPAFAADVEVDEAGASKTVKHVQNYKHSKGSVSIYTYNINSDNKSYITLTGEKSNETLKFSFGEYYNHPTSFKADINETYKIMVGASLGSSGGAGGGQSVNFKDTEGKYEAIRFKLRNFDSYFNSDGSHTQGDHTYNFREERLSNGDIYSSVLVFVSGSAITCATPDKNGEVEIVVSKRIGQDTRYMTTFLYEIRSNGFSSGSKGGTTGTYVKGLTMGDTDLSGWTNITDATYTQMNCAKVLNFDSLQKRNADVNYDGKIDITDATLIQMYSANVYK